MVAPTRRRTGELPVAARAALMAAIVAFGVWLTVGPIHESWGRAALTVVIGLAFGSLTVAFGPQRPVFHNVVRLIIFVGFVVLIAMHGVFGGVAFAWLFSAAVGMNLGSGGWTNSTKR